MNSQLLDGMPGAVVTLTPTPFTHGGRRAAAPVVRLHRRAHPGPTELPVGITTTVIGAPYLLFLLLRGEHRSGIA